MPKTIIVDSSAIVSLALPADSNNAKALRISRDILHTKEPLIIPGDVFSEALNVLGRKTGHKGAVVIGTNILKDRRFTIEEVTVALRLRALEKFKEQAESTSFTDCLVMALADEFETKEIFGFDETFQKNGYRRIGIDNS